MQEQILLQSKIEQGDFTRGGEASSTLKDILRKLGVKSDLLRRVTIITYELEMNIIIHSLGGEITVFISSEQVKVVAEDQGPGIADVERAFQPGYSTANDHVRDMGFGAGMGLNNVEHYSDQLMVDTGEGERSKFTAIIHL
ncbi:MAG: ATP-binding protein [Limnochordia bacterium]|jgi:anti-sigma regulatory factor (Ser/Thr protein kinase)|nr:ATP-binding protein [Limnochordia bacterium]